MDDNTRFILEQLNEHRKEFKADLSEIKAGVSKIQAGWNRLVGAAMAVSGIVSAGIQFLIHRGA